MSNILGGKQGTAYLGTNANSPVNITYAPRPPTQYDNQNYSVGDEWLDTAALDVWKLLDLSGSSVSKGPLALWVLMASGVGTVVSVEGDNAVAVFPTPAGTINIIGDTLSKFPLAPTIGITGTAITHTLEAQVIGPAIDGQVIISSAGGLPQWANLVSGDGSINIINGPNSIDLRTVGGGVGIAQLTGGQGGTAAGANVTIDGAHWISVTGNNISTLTVAVTNTITLGDLVALAPGVDAVTAQTGDIEIIAGNLKLPITNTGGTHGVYKAGASRFIHNYGTDNTFVGLDAGNTALTSTNCSGFGSSALFSLTDAIDATAVGAGSLTSLTSGDDNTAVGTGTGVSIDTGEKNSILGSYAGFKATSASFNTLLGYKAGYNVLTGTENIIIGSTAGNALVGAESSNVYISNNGVAAESNTLRVGTNGALSGEQNRAFMAGINGNALAAQGCGVVVIDTATSQLGVTAIGNAGQVLTSQGAGLPPHWAAGGGGGTVSTLTGDTGGAVSPVANNINIISDVTAQTAGQTVLFKGSAAKLTLNVTDAAFNTTIGKLAGSPLASGNNNTALGYSALNAAFTASFNVAIGDSALLRATSAQQCTIVGSGAAGGNISSGGFNTGCGYGTLQTITTGLLNIGLGWSAGSAWSGADSYNTCIGNQTGIAGESGVIRIGSPNAPSAANIFIGGNAGNSTTATGTQNTCIGNNSLSAITTGGSNTFMGVRAGKSITTSFYNVGLGVQALQNLSTSIGQNVAVGVSAGISLTTGQTNCLLGYTAGQNYTSSESSNILILNTGVASESHTTRIGTQGGGDGQQNRAFMAGISGVTPAGGNGVVIVNSSGQLGATTTGTAGQVLTSNGAAAAPSFQAGGGGGFGSPDYFSAYYPINSNTPYGSSKAYYLGSLTVLQNVHEVGGGFFPGTYGIIPANAAFFQAPVNGMYYFTMSVGIQATTNQYAGYPPIIFMQAPTITYSNQANNSLVLFTNGSGQPDGVRYFYNSFSALVYLNALDKIYFGFFERYFTGTNAFVLIGSYNAGAPMPISNPTYVMGYRVA